MLTLANITEGHASFHIGGGEAKQCQPFGHKRSEGLSRMEDLFRIFHALWESDGPIDFAGKRWRFEKASIGNAKPHRPRLYGLGGGPQLLDHTTSYADGLAVACPSVWPTAERFADARAEILREVERKGRDPGQFRFAVWFPVMLARDQQQLEHALGNPIVRGSPRSSAASSTTAGERTGSTRRSPRTGATTSTCCRTTRRRRSSTTCSPR